jgi:flagellar hook-associated protein 1 FlgK
MSDLLAIGTAGVRVFQAALAQVGDNVANADTPGYVKRSLTIATGAAGAGSPLSRDVRGGAGVVAGVISRSTDPLAANAARVADGAQARYASRSDWLGRLQTVLTGSDVDSRLGGFFDAGSDLAATPTSGAARAVFLDRTGQLTSAFQGLGTGLAGLADDIGSATTAATTRVNAITAALASVNTELRRTQPDGSGANGLLDSRDQLLGELAGNIGISVTEGALGTVTVRLGSGAAGALLVSPDGGATRIGVTDGAGGPTLILDPTHDATAVSLPATGSLAGLLEAARQIRSTTSDVDALATRFGSAINAWHSAGTDALGDPGTALVAVRDLAVTPGRANAGTAAMDVKVGDDQFLQAGGYKLHFDAGNWTLARSDGTAEVTGTGPLLLDGVTVRPGSGARDGDSFALGIVDGARGLGLRAIGPARLAVADRFITDAAASNSGDAQIAVTTDATAAGLAGPPPWRVTVTAAGSIDITDLASGTLIASAPLDGTPIVGTGFSFTLQGTPAAGDSFRILATGAASNDNGNALALAAVRAAVGPAGTLETSLDATTALVGAQLSESLRLEATAQSVKDDTAKAADAVSGVDLDQEAADLTRLQVAYRANAQVLATARAMFDAMLAVLQ